ncbi:MAG: hypothetical protein AMS25_08150 [Gemmatimonas sp. SM23_52]|nr:MAG: hypothetical protein AMS25_08150 [Gemmatimonas sp. SM23_52]
MIKRLCGLTLLLVLVGASPALAQLPGIGIDLTAYGGVFVPLNDIVDDEDIGTGKHESALAVGGRLTLGLPGPLGVEGTFNYALSDVGADSDTEGAHVWSVSGRAVFEFGLPAAPLTFFVNGGIAYIGRGGDAYDEVEDKSNVGGVAGVGLKVGLPGLLAIRLDAEDYIYSAKPTIGGLEPADSQLQNDIVVSAGLVFSIGP